MKGALTIDKIALLVLAILAMAGASYIVFSEVTVFEKGVTSIKCKVSEITYCELGSAWNPACGTVPDCPTKAPTGPTTSTSGPTTTTTTTTTTTIAPGMCTSACQSHTQKFASGTCRSAGPAGMLRVEGTKLVDEKGNEIHLRGITVQRRERIDKEGTKKRAAKIDETYFQEADVDVIVDAGANIIDIMVIHLNDIMPSRGNTDESYFINWIDHWVSWLEEREIYYIINLRSFRNTKSSLTSYGPHGMPRWIWEDYYEHGWWNDPDAMEKQAKIIHDFYDSSVPKMEKNRQAFIEAWAYIADRYKDNKYVMFSPTNEPLHHTKDYMTDSSSKMLGREYSKLMTRVIDAIRATGAKQIIFIDRPYLKSFQHITPINRDNVVWEAHSYVSSHNPNLDSWKRAIDRYVQRFVNEFKKPLLIGEYGIGGPDYRFKLSDWKATLAGEVSYMDSLPLCGREFFDYGQLAGEWLDSYSEADSQYILQTVLGGESVSGEECLPKETSIGQDGCDSGFTCCCSGELPTLTDYTFSTILSWNDVGGYHIWDESKFIQ